MAGGLKLLPWKSPTQPPQRQGERSQALCRRKSEKSQQKLIVIQFLTASNYYTEFISLCQRAITKIELVR